MWGRHWRALNLHGPQKQHHLDRPSTRHEENIPSLLVLPRTIFSPDWRRVLVPTSGSCMEDFCSRFACQSLEYQRKPHIKARRTRIDPSYQPPPLTTPTPTDLATGIQNSQGPQDIHRQLADFEAGIQRVRHPSQTPSSSRPRLTIHKIN